MNKLCIGLLVSIARLICPAVSSYAIKSAQLPIAFCVVREDSVLDLEIIKRYFSEEKISMCMVASGGCTAALLAAQAPIKDLTLVDPNKAQLDLTKLKIFMLSIDPLKRLEILGYLPQDLSLRKSLISSYLYALDIDQKSLGDLNAVASSGLDFAGRYEKVFEQLRAELKDHQKDLRDLFQCISLEDQMRAIAPLSTLGRALDQALAKVMSQENLVHIFGPKATANRVQEFSQHFAQQIRKYLAHHKATESPWLAHMLLGTCAPAPLFPWLTAQYRERPPQIIYFQGFMNDLLKQAKENYYHVIHLSNIIDWLDPEEAQATLQLAYRALQPGGVVILRQLNSTVDIMKLGKNFLWDTAMSQEFLARDRSFFYRNFLIGTKPRISDAPRMLKLADQVLHEIPVISGRFFKDLPTMHLDQFRAMQAQFFFAVDYFSRPMAALIARLPEHAQRIDIIHNIVEEHGDFVPEKYHSNTFRKFLQSIQVTDAIMRKLQPDPAVTMFNYALMGACTQADPLEALACNGIIEYAFADISAQIAQTVINRQWVKKEDLVHYNLHAQIDKRHAEEFFKILEPAMSDKAKRELVVRGLYLGAYIFHKLYEDLYTSAQKLVLDH